MTPSAHTSHSRRFTAITGATLGITTLLLIHRNWGIDHDATLYFGQALAQHEPGLFRNDLFFLNGSQASYTTFPWLTGHLLGYISPLPLFVWGGLIGLLLFAASSWYCLRALLPNSQRYWAWLAVLALPTFYGRTIIFSYAEPFFTPRPFAEGLCLFAVGLLARQRLALAILCLLVAGLLHPLPTIAASLILWPWLVLQNRRWLHALWTIIPLLAISLSGVRPFDGLITPLDPVWLTQLRAINGQLFVTGWAWMDYRILALDVLLLGMAWRIRRDGFGIWCLAALLGLVLGICSSLILVDSLHLVLPAGLQLWRVHWLAHWMAMAAMGTLLFDACVHRDFPHAALLIMTGLLVWGGQAWLWLPSAALYLAWPFVLHHIRGRTRMLLGGLFMLGISLLLVQYASNEWANFRLAGSRLDLYAIDKRLLSYPIIALGLPLLGWAVWQRSNSLIRLMMALMLLCPAAIITGLRWDIRSPQRRVLDTHFDTPTLFNAHIPHDATVYWDSMSLLGTWSVLHRSDYYDPQQLSGLAFNRGTLDTALARIARLAPLMDESFACQQQAAASSMPVACRISIASLRQACAPGRPRPPDYLVLPYWQGSPVLGTWILRDPQTLQPMSTFWLYRCHDIASALR